MSVQVEKLEKSMAKLTIEVPAEELEKAIQNAYNKDKNKIQLPGFRKGKAPRKMIERMYGVGVFYEDAANELINNEYPKAADECGESIVSSPKIEVVQIESGKPFIFTAEVALKPPVGLGKYKGIKVTKQDTEVTQEILSFLIQILCRMMSILTVIPMMWIRMIPTILKILTVTHLIIRAAAVKSAAAIPMKST